MRDDPNIPVTAESLVVAARLLLVPRLRLKRVALGRGVEVPELVPLGAEDSEDALAVLRRICGPAAVCLRRAIDLDPDCAEAHSLLAEIYEEFAEAAAAVAHRRRALALRPDDEGERTALARSLLNANCTEEAQSILRQSAVVQSAAQFRVLHSVSFENWVAQQGASLVELSRPTSLHYNFNVVVDGQLIPTTTEIHQRGISVAEVESLTMFRGFIPIASGGTYIHGTIQHRPETQLPGIPVVGERNVIIHELAAEETIEEPCLVLCGFPMHYRNYFHAVAQNFVRLPLILRKPEFAHLRIAVSERIQPWGVEFLAAIGVCEDRLIYVKQDRSTVIRKAFLPSPPTRHGLPSVAEVEALRNALFAEKAPSSPVDRLFITRGKLAKLRRVLMNEAALQDIAVRHGHQVIDPASMSIFEQIEAFSQSAVICGATGAGLTNLLYAPKDAAILCFSPREACRSYYLHLSAVTEQRFTWCLGSFLPEALASSDFPQLPYEVGEDSVCALFEMQEGGRL